VPAHKFLKSPAPGQDEPPQERPPREEGLYPYEGRACQASAPRRGSLRQPPSPRLRHEGESPDDEADPGQSPAAIVDIPYLLFSRNLTSGSSDCKVPDCLPYGFDVSRNRRPNNRNSDHPS